MSVIVAIIFAILIFSVLIFVHELGHFLAAKASGGKVIVQTERVVDEGTLLAKNIVAIAINKNNIIY